MCCLFYHFVFCEGSRHLPSLSLHMKTLYHLSLLEFCLIKFSLIDGYLNFIIQVEWILWNLLKGWCYYYVISLYYVHIYLGTYTPSHHYNSWVKTIFHFFSSKHLCNVPLSQLVLGQFKQNMGGPVHLSFRETRW